MRTPMLAIATAVALATELTVQAPARASDDLAVKASKHSVKETIVRLVKALEEKGITPVARVDHAAAAKSNGLDMRPAEVVMFGNPKVGTPLMQANPLVAIDLPMRVLAWQDAAGKTWVAYTKPEALKARYKLANNDEQLKAMAGALEAFTKAATE